MKISPIRELKRKSTRTNTLTGTFWYYRLILIGFMCREADSHKSVEMARFYFPKMESRIKKKKIKIRS